MRCFVFKGESAKRMGSENVTQGATAMSADEALDLLCKWVAAGEKRSFSIEYGYGISEVPVVTFNYPGFQWVEIIDGKTGLAGAVERGIKNATFAELKGRK